MTVLENLKKLNERVDRAVETIQALKNCMNCDHCEIEEDWRLCCTADNRENFNSRFCDSWKMEEIK